MVGEHQHLFQIRWCTSSMKRKTGSTLFPMKPIRPTPTGDTFRLLMCLLNFLRTQTDIYIPTICLLTIRTYVEGNFAPSSITSFFSCSFGNSSKISSSSSKKLSDTLETVSKNWGISCCSTEIDLRRFPELWCDLFNPPSFCEMWGLNIKGLSDVLKLILAELLSTRRNLELVKTTWGVASNESSGQSSLLSQSMP